MLGAIWEIVLVTCSVVQNLSQWSFGFDTAGYSGEYPIDVWSFQRHEASEECPVHIYDSKGFETFETELDQLQKLVEERRVAAAMYHVDDPRRITEQLHAVWWVIDVIGGGRFQPEQMMKLVFQKFFFPKDAL